MQDPSKPIWFDKKTKTVEITNKKNSFFVATPVHSDVSIHYLQACLDFQKECFKKDILVSFQLMKSSLVTQGRNLCVSGFMESNHTHLLFIDSDIDFLAESVFKMADCSKDVISVAYPLKTFNWEKGWRKIQEGKIKSVEDLRDKAFYQYPMKVADEKNIIIKDGVIEVTHSPTGCMLIKRSVIERMIEAYPDKEIKQGTIINGELMDRRYFYNLFDTDFDPKTKTYLGEDFAFCKRWKDIGGKCHALVTEKITHAGEHCYKGCFGDELSKSS
tara:strand:- start:24 stop:842 length:819 start_codon:yes stop_codon:yes gene_type:complete